MAMPPLFSGCWATNIGYFDIGTLWTRYFERKAAIFFIDEDRADIAARGCLLMNTTNSTQNCLARAKNDQQ